MAQNTLEIIIKANSSKAVSEIKKLDTAIGKTSSASAKGFDAIKAKWNALDAKLSSPGGWKIMMSAAGAAVGVLTTVGVTVKKLADDFMNYAFQVEDFGRIIGATPEDASKLIQVADDVRLSTEKMTVAMKNAIDKGYSPSIESLKKLSDEYLAIQDGEERTRFVMDIFGQRAGPEMAKLLELGSDAIDKMGKSIEGTGRLMTTQGIQAAKDYYAALDNLNDATADLSLTFGQKLVPAMTDGVNLLVDVGTSALSSENVLTNMTQAILAQRITTQDAAAVMTLYVAGIIDGAEANKIFRGPVDTSTNALLEQRRAMQFATEGASGLADELGDVAQQANKSASDLKRLAEATKIKNVEIGLEFTIPDVAAQMDNLITSIDWNAAGGAALSEFMKGFAGRVAPLTDEEKKQIAAQVGAVDIALKVETGEITKNEGIQQLMDLGNMKWGEASAAIDKIVNLKPADIGPYLDQITQLASPEVTGAAAEQTGALNTQTQTLGETTGKLLESLTAWKDNVGELKENAKYGAQYTENLNRQIAALPKKVTLIVDIITNGSLPDLGDDYTGSTGNKPGPRVKKGATGLDMIVPPGYRSDNYPIYATSGERVLIQTPAQQKNEKTVNINNVFNIAANAPINVRELARQVVREQQRAGVT